MKILILISLFMFYVDAGKDGFDLHGIYKVHDEICTFRGSSYTGSVVLDVSGQDLDSLDGISKLVICYNKLIWFLSSVPRVNIIASNNNLKTLPKELMKLNLISIDVAENPEFKIPKWVFEKANFRVYYSTNNKKE